MPKKSAPKIVIPDWNPQDPTWKCYLGGGEFATFASTKLVPTGTIVQVSGEYIELEGDAGLYGQPGSRLRTKDRSFGVNAVEAAKIPSEAFIAAKGLIDNPERTYIKLSRRAGLLPEPLEIDGKPCEAMKNIPAGMIASAVGSRLDGLNKELEKRPNAKAVKLIEHESKRAGVSAPPAANKVVVQPAMKTARLPKLVAGWRADVKPEAKARCFDALRELVESDGTTTAEPITVGREGQMIGLSLKSAKRLKNVLFLD